MTEPQLAWDSKRTDSWRQVLSTCAARLKAQPGRPGARCVLRSVAEQLRQPSAEPYRSLVRRVAPLAREAGVPVIEQFEGTWAGAAAGILRHHDSTRIHFSDTGARPTQPNSNHTTTRRAALPGSCTPQRLGARPRRPSPTPTPKPKPKPKPKPRRQAASSSRSSRSTRCRSCCSTARCRLCRGRGSCGWPMFWNTRSE